MKFWTLMLTCLVTTNAFSQGTQQQYAAAAKIEKERFATYRDRLQLEFFNDQEQYAWYRNRTGADAWEFVVVDLAMGVRRIAFDHEKLAAKLAEATGKDLSSQRLDLHQVRFFDDVNSVTFSFDAQSWQYSIGLNELSPGEATAGSEPYGLRPRSSHRRSRGGDVETAIIFDNQLAEEVEIYWITGNGDRRSYGRIPAGKRHEQHTFNGHAWLVALPSSGADLCSFVAERQPEAAVISQENISRASEPTPRDRTNDRTQNRTDETSHRFEVRNHNLFVTIDGELLQLTNDGTEESYYRADVIWSPDMSACIVMRTRIGDRRQVAMIDSSPSDQVQPRVKSVPYDKPGDRLDSNMPYVWHVGDRELMRIDHSTFPNPFELNVLGWKDDSSEFRLAYNERGHQTYRVLAVSKQGIVRTIIEEKSDTFFCYSQKQFLELLDATEEAIWMSERDGWNHLYLVDQRSGTVKNQITKGEWVVRQVEFVDPVRREIWFTASGLDRAQDPYNRHLLRIGFDGKNLIRLTADNGNHEWTFSPQRRWIVDRYSRVDMPAITELRDATDGKLVCTLEQADISEWSEAGWKPPQPFVAKGRDGQTDIFGIIVRPRAWDASKKYPVLEYIYAGPHSSFVPKSFGRNILLEKFAELGFVVVQIDGMGTSNRNKEFHDVCWKNIGDAGFPDRIAWIKSAALQHPEMDLSKGVGIWGGSAGGQNALRALLAHGDFYYAASADCGCHDNRMDKIWWNEQWMGWPIGDQYEAQSNVTCAHQLQGKLLLTVGELDTNVDPASTMQVVNALIKADKDFELIVFPGADHGAGSSEYGTRRTMDFFVRHLWRREPRQE